MQKGYMKPDEEREIVTNPDGSVESRPRGRVLSQPEADEKGDFRCGWHNCKRTFDSEAAVRMHRIRAHVKRWSGVPKKWPDKPNWQSKEYRRMKYREQVERYHAKGLNAHGQPFKNSAVSIGMQKAHNRRRAAGIPHPLEKSPSRMSAKGKRNVAMAQFRRRERERQQLLNGAAATPPPTPEQDNMGDSARAIIMAAQVLRAVSLGIKL